MSLDTSSKVSTSAIEEAERLLDSGNADAAYARLADLRLGHPEDDRVAWLLARCIAGQHGPEAALGFIRSSDAAAAMPALSEVVTRQAAELLETRLLALHQSGVIDRLSGGIGRLQGINDSLGERMRSLEAIDRGARSYADSELAMSAAPSSWRRLSVLFVSGDPGSPSHDYRVRNYVDALATQQVTSEVVNFGEFDRLADAVPRASLAVFWRCPLRADLLPAIHLCRQHRIPTVFDVDDYVFEPRIAKPEIIDGIRFVAPKDVELYYWGIKVYRRLLLACDATTMTTQYLADRVVHLGRSVYVLPNGLDAKYVAAGNASTEPARTATGTVTIGYAPGSKTHQKDFAGCALEVAQILREHPDVRLSIIGPLDLDEFAAFDGLRKQIAVDPTLGRDHLRRKLGEVDIHIAPVEMNNPFTESKSELKYFEPAALGIPTIASATQPFRAAIENGVTGFLATTAEDWRRGLSKLVTDQTFRTQMGIRARTHALQAYGPAALGRRAKSAYAEIIRRHRSGHGLTDRSLSICALLDDDRRRHRDDPVVALLRGLTDLGHHLRIHFVRATTIAGNGLREEYDLPPSVAVSAGPLTFKPTDIVMATSAATAQIAHGLRQRTAVCCHLVSNYESLLHAPGHARAIVDASYASDLRHLACGPFIARKLAHSLGSEPPAIPHFLDHRVFAPGTAAPSRDCRIVVVGAQADASGLDRLAALAIKAARRRLDRKIEVDVIGDWREAIGPEYRLHGIPSAQVRANLFRHALLGLALTPSAPSSFAFEMMACGLPVIDVAAPETEEKYGPGPAGPILVSATVNAVANAIAGLGNSTERRKQVDRGLSFVRDLPSEHEAADRLDAVLAGLVETSDAGR
jgi:glycosyltransferase involved in cell wall biosynthesis